MKTIKAEPITNEAFAPFGQFYTMDKPQGYALCGELHSFYPDRINADSTHRVGYSPIVVKKPEKMIITQQEYHTTTWEMILPMDDDMILHVAPASAGTPVTDLAKAFIVPKHTLVKMNAAIWHLAPLPANNEQLTAMIILPECTYANDCTVVDLNEEQQFEIVK
ncbi:MAG: ureidoglycolate lyase [Clostridia bacterium]|nr:ureidoglycolate lyase [Clostridia bacterium]